MRNCTVPASRTHLHRISTWTATVDPINHRSTRLLRSIGLQLTWDDGELVGRGPVPPGLAHARAREAARLAHRQARVAAARWAPAAA